MTALSSRVEALEGADQGMDALIALALGITGDPEGYPPAFTASLDAALSLLPKGCELDWEVNTFPIGKRSQCARVGPGRIQANAATPALALTAAALKARGL